LKHINKLINKQEYGKLITKWIKRNIITNLLGVKITKEKNYKKVWGKNKFNLELFSSFLEVFF
jgi:hypothetical protein